MFLQRSIRKILDCIGKNNQNIIIWQNDYTITNFALRICTYLYLAYARPVIF